MTSLSARSEPNFDALPSPMGLVVIVRLAGAAIWALALGILGLWIASSQPLPGYLDRVASSHRLLIGTGLLCGGQLVFLRLVAERAFPKTPRAIRSRVYLGLVAVGGACFLLVLLGRTGIGGL